MCCGDDKGTGNEPPSASMNAMCAHLKKLRTENVGRNPRLSIKVIGRYLVVFMLMLMTMTMIIITDAAATFDVDAIPSALVSVLLKNRC